MAEQGDRALTLTPRERFARIMAHQEADRVPLDLAGTGLTSIYGDVALGLRRLLGHETEPVGPYAPLDERTMQDLHLDLRHVGTLIGSGRHACPTDPHKNIDMWGIVRAWTGQYWDIVVQPLRGATLADLERYRWPDPDRLIDVHALAEYRAEARRLRETTDYVVVASHPVYGVLELACWLCGFDDFLWRLAGDLEFVHALFARLLALQKAFIEPYYEALGEFIDVTTSGDDFGTQKGPFISPATFRSLIKPYMAERVAFTRRFTKAYYWHHTCGSVFHLLPDLIDAGVQILNPVQPGAYMMEPARLKAAYGDQVTFHGGFDTQRVLPFGTAAEIDAEVQRVMAALKPGGGYVFSAAHNIQSDVPPENVVTMLRAAERLGRYNL